MDQIWPKREFVVQKTEKLNHHWILHIRISLSTIFHFKQSIWNFGTKFAQKGNLRSKRAKLNISIEFCIFELVEVPNFGINWKFWFFGTNLSKKGISSWKWNNWTSPLHSACSNYPEYQIPLYTNKFEFWDQICPKRVFSVEKERVNITIEFYIFKLALVPYFILNKQFWILMPNLRKTGVLYQKWKEWTSPLNYAYSN